MNNEQPMKTLADVIAGGCYEERDGQIVRVDEAATQAGTAPTEADGRGATAAGAAGGAPPAPEATQARQA